MIDKKECPHCEFYDSMYGCMNHDCGIYVDYEQGMKEMMADFDHDRRKEDNLNPIFEQALRPFKGEV